MRDVVLPGGAGVLALVTLDNGLDHTKPNTLGAGGLASLHGALVDVQRRAADGEIVAVGVTGKPWVLAAGADLTAVAGITDERDARAVAERGHATYRLLGEMAVPTFAYVNGIALGGGLELALACTYRTVAADVTALALPETFLGLVPGWGGCYLLPRLVGVRNALELVLTRPLANNRMTTAAQAVELGVVDVVLHPADFLEQSLVWTADVLTGRVEVARRPLDDAATWDATVAAARAALDARLHGARRAPYRALDLVAAARTSDRDAAFAAEDDALTELIMSDELRAGLYAFDLTTRKARTPAGAPPADLAAPVRSVGIVGAGLMAGQLAVLVARRLRVPVTLRDLDDERVAAGRAGIRKQVEGLVAKGRISADEANRLLASVAVTTDLGALAGADLVVEAVTEVMSVKQRVFAELEELVGEDTVLATNTSALSVAAMSAHLRHPERVVGLHFFNPVAQMPLVEVVRTPASGDRAVATAFAVARRSARRRSASATGRGSSSTGSCCGCSPRSPRRSRAARRSPWPTSRCVRSGCRWGRSRSCSSSACRSRCTCWPRCTRTWATATRCPRARAAGPGGAAGGAGARRPGRRARRRPGDPGGVRRPGPPGRAR